MRSDNHRLKKTKFKIKSNQDYQTLGIDLEVLEFKELNFKELDFDRLSPIKKAVSARSRTRETHNFYQ